MAPMARSSRFVWAVLKNHSLLHEARMLRSTLKGMDSVQPRRKVFSNTVIEAVWFTYIAVMAKALENRAQVASIWYLLRVDETTFNRFVKSNQFDTSDLLEICEKLKIVRDKSHFHVDRDFTTNDAFREASIPWSRLEAVVDNLYEYLTHLRTVDLGLTGLTDHGYSETDAVIATIAIEESGSGAI